MFTLKSAALACALLPPLFAQSTYKITDLGTLPGSTSSIATAINNSGQVVGNSGDHAFLWQNGVMTDLGTLPGSTSSTATAINNSGQVVVNSGNHAFFWHNGVMTDLGTLPGYTGRVAAYAINDSGQVVGYAVHAFLWQNGVMRDLGAFSSPPQTCDSYTAYGINSRGQVVGNANIGSCAAPDSESVFFWENGVMTDLINFGRGFLGPTVINELGQIAGYFVDDIGPSMAWIWDNDAISYVLNFESASYGINDSGQVAGYHAPTPSSDRHAFFWDKGVTTDLGTLPGFPQSFAYGINNQGQVVGTSVDFGGFGHAFFWKDSAMSDLGTLPGSTFSTASRINNIEQLSCQSGNVDSFGRITTQHAVRWDPPADATPRVTTATPSPGPNTNGWNNTNVTVKLTSTDSEPGGTGVKEIHFTLAGAQTGNSVASGNTASVLITAEGTTGLTYFDIDNAGNSEAAKSLTVKIDKTHPVISGLPAPGCTLWPPDSKFVQVATVTAIDALSGLASGSFKVTGTSNEPSNKPEIIISPDGSGGYVVQLLADRLGTGTGRVYTLTATASDLAGNRATMNAPCTVPLNQANR